MIIKIVILTNIPAPYREPVFDLVSKSAGIKLHVIYCAALKSDREWNINFGKYKKYFLNENFSKASLHYSFKAIKLLNDINPDVIITTGFNPIMLGAFAWALAYNRPHIPFTDGTIQSESSLTIFHRIIRHIVFSKSVCFIGASNKSRDLYLSYGQKRNYIFKSCLCIDNEIFYSLPFDKRHYEIMFSGQFIDRKMPFFFAEVAKYIAKNNGNCRALILGNGILRDRFINAFDNNKIEVNFTGFVSQEELPLYYSKSKFLLFPTKSDPWGVVSNEAAASGTPIITCKNAGVSDELVIHKKTGLVLDMNVKIWGDAVIDLLNDHKKWETMSKAALHNIKNFTSEQAAEGIINAVKFAIFKRFPSIRNRLKA